MKPHPITRFRTATARRAEFVHQGETFAFSSAGTLGDDILAIAYPDAAEAARECRHAALVNGRKRPYPPDAYASAVAIGRTLLVESGQETPDLCALLAVFDGDPELFQRATEAALGVLGLLGEGPEIGGAESWDRVVAHLHAGEAEKAMAVAMGALRALRPAASEPLELGDPVLEQALGNS